MNISFAELSIRSSHHEHTWGSWLKAIGLYLIHSGLEAATQRQCHMSVG